MKRSNDEGGEGGETNIENKMQQQQQQLPHELITEILLRLPVKSLVRFKCVCKSWLSLISDSHFATSHFDLTTTNVHTHCHRLLLIKFHTSEARSIDFQALLNHDRATASLNLNFLLPQSHVRLQIGGSCRGFLFLHSYHTLSHYLWNPSTGIYRHLPLSPIVSNVEIRFFIDLYAFGYDPSTDDYLVILGSSNTMVTDDLIHLEFFSLRANTWKEIEAHLPYMSSSDNSRVGTFFNGAIHWLAYRVDISVNVIVAFHLTERTISEISLPDDSAFYPNPYTNLTDCDLWVFRGFMSLWALENGPLEIWVMKEYGVNSSWTKTLVLRIGYFSPICSTDCGDIVGSDGNIGLIRYNDNGRVLEHRPCCYLPHGSQVAIYTESLLPLPLPDTQQP